MDERPTPPTPPTAGTSTPPPSSHAPFFYNAPHPAMYGYTAPPTEPSPITLRDVAQVLRRRAGLVLFTFTATLVVVGVVTARMTPMYSSDARILLDQTPSPAAGNLKDLLLSGAVGGSLDTEIEKIRSRAFLSEVLRVMQRDKMAMQANPEDLSSRLSLSPQAGGSILGVSVRAPSPEEAARTANVVGDVYIAYARQESDKKAELAKSRLRQSAEAARQEKDAAERDWEAFLEKVGISDPASLYLRRAQKTLDVRSSLEDAQKSLPLQENKVRLLEEQLTRLNPTMVAGYSMEKNPKINQYRDEINDLEKERGETLENFGPESEEIRDIDRKIKERKEQLQVVLADPYSKGGVSIGRNNDYVATQTALTEAKRSVKETRRQIEVLAADLKDKQAEQRRLAPQSAEYQQLFRRVEMTREAFAKASNGLIQIDINKSTSVPNITFLDKARPIPTPVRPKPLLNAIMAVFLGSFLGVGIALLAEYMAGPARTNREQEEGGNGLALPALPSGAEVGYAAALPRVGGVPLLAQVPVGSPLSAFHTVDRNGLPPVPVNQTAAVEDAFREIGYVLAHHEGRRSSISGLGREAAAAGRVPVILFSGTRSDETAAAVAAQLCATLVRDGLRVTLVDADRAHPRLNRVFGAPDAPGVADVLAGRVSARDILYTGADGSLRFLAAGAPKDAAAEMNEPGLRALFDDLSAPSETDLVVVSGPSVWSARQIGPLEKAADGMVLVAPDAVPPAESVARARRLLSNGYQPHILGVVVGRDIAGAADNTAPLPAAPATHASSSGTEE